MYITYEEPFKDKTFTLTKIKEIYADLVDKAEYPDFECWLHDMLHSGVFVEEEQENEEE